ncbi:pyruvate kinase [Allostella vacuolata]|nr:pyruvate kinase [Stella vacuolata]
MRRTRSTKIVATLGPASGTPEVIGALFDAGVDVFRLNFSHGTHEEHRVRYDIIRAIEQDRKRPIGILVDLQGPKLRVGTFADGKILLKAGQSFRLDLTDRPGDETRAPLPHPEIFEAISPGTDLLLDDGRIRLRVDKVRGKSADTVVITGGPLSNRKGVNVPNAVLPVSALTDKDRRDLRFGLELGADWIALSFVQRPEDVADARKLIEGRAAVMVKLEKPQAIERLQEILDLTDAVMVARGDLGVEMPPEDVPGLQKRIVRACRVAGKPVVVATQMLESMVQSPAPTRAEASDVATAVYDGADAVMLSAETAAGAYPLEAVAIMNRIIARVEQDPLYRPIMDAEHSAPESTAADAITAAAAQVAQTIGAAAICTFTTSGSTTLRAARERPAAPILGLTANLGTARRLAVLWGVHWVLTRDIRSFSDMVERSRKVAVQEGIARSGDRIVITAGVPFGTPGSTNTLRIAWVE